MTITLIIWYSENKKLKINVLLYWIYSYICGIMKKILFYLSIALAIFTQNSSGVQDNKLGLGFKIVEHQYAFNRCEPNSYNLIFEACLEDRTDDDSNDSERKKHSLGNMFLTNAAFFTQNISDHFYKKVRYPKFFSQCRIPLFIFINVFRL